MFFILLMNECKQKSHHLFKDFTFSTTSNKSKEILCLPLSSMQHIDVQTFIDIIILKQRISKVHIDKKSGSAIIQLKLYNEF